MDIFRRGRSLRSSLAKHSAVILGLVPRICDGSFLLTVVDPRDKPEDDVETRRTVFRLF
jgi:hypothetical protein